MLSRTLKMAFWVGYDHLGKLMIASAIWFVCWLPLCVLSFAAFCVPDRSVSVFLGVPLAILGVCVGLPVATAGLAHMVKELIDTRDGSIRTMFEGIRLYSRRAVGLGFFYGFLLSCLGVNVWFYAVKFGSTFLVLAYGISGIALWLLFFCILTGVVVFPTLVQKKSGVFATFRLAALLTLDNFFLVLVVMLHVLALTVLGAVVFPFLVFGYGAALAVLTGSFYEILSRKYAAIEVLSSSSSGVKLSPITKRRFTREDYETFFHDEQDDYLNRGFRDFLFPWKG